MPNSDDRRTYSIRQLCREFGATARALRFYEDKGLLSPSRRGQTRVFSSRDRARLRLILQGKRVGFSLAEIRDMLELYDRKDGGATQMAASLGRFRAQLDKLKAQREDIDAAIDTLTVGCAWIEQRLAEFRPDLLPQADDYHSVLKARLGDEDDEDEDAPLPRNARTRS